MNLEPWWYVEGYWEALNRDYNRQDYEDFPASVTQVQCRPPWHPVVQVSTADTMIA